MGYGGEPRAVTCNCSCGDELVVKGARSDSEFANRVCAAVGRARLRAKSLIRKAAKALHAVFVCYGADHGPEARTSVD